MVHSRVSFSLVCQSPAETDSDHSTMPMSACGQESTGRGGMSTGRRLYDDAVSEEVARSSLAMSRFNLSLVRDYGNGAPDIRSCPRDG